MKIIEDKIATIDDLKKDVLQQYGINELMEKLDIIQKEKTLINDSLPDHVKYMMYDIKITEQEKCVSLSKKPGCKNVNKHVKGELVK